MTFGQYMRPTKKHMKVDRYVEPVEFDRWKEIAEELGFLYVASGPLVRSSYKVSSVYNSTTTYTELASAQAGEFYIENVLRGKGTEARTKQLVADESVTHNINTNKC